MDFLLSEMVNSLMNREFIIDPLSFTNATELKYILEKFGFFQGRLLAKYPSSWIKSVHGKIQSWPDLEKKRAQELLIRTKEMIVPISEPYDPEVQWIDNAQNIFSNKKIDGVIAAEKNTWGFPTILDIEDDYFESGRDIRLNGCATNYAIVSKRLLQMSYEITLVDPYLKLEKKGCARVFKEFLKTAQEGKCKYINIWTRYEISGMKNESAFKQMLLKEYKTLLNKDTELNIKLVDDDNSIEKMHARLMLSKLGGFRFDHGFEEFSDNRNVDISILDKTTHNQHCMWYLDKNSQNDFKVIEEHSLIGD